VEIEEEINELKQNLKRYEEKLNYNNELIEQTQREIAERTKEVKLLRKSHEIFLLEILKRGKDCRYK
jgi:chromosome segregation ATPase